VRDLVPSLEAGEPKNARRRRTERGEFRAGAGGTGVPRVREWRSGVRAEAEEIEGTEGCSGGLP